MPMAAMHEARASVPELPRRCENGRQSTGAVAAPAVRARPVGHDAADHLRRLCVAAGRPAASDDETDAHCASVARPVWAARPQFSCSARIACPRGRKSGPVRTQHTLGACSHSAEEQQDRGQAWAVPQVRRSPNKSESGGVVAKMSMYDVKPAQSWHSGKSCSRRCLSTSAKKITQRGRQWKWRRNAWPSGRRAPRSCAVVHDARRMTSAGRDVKGGAGHALF